MTEGPTVSIVEAAAITDQLEGDEIKKLLGNIEKAIDAGKLNSIAIIAFMPPEKPDPRIPEGTDVNAIATCFYAGKAVYAVPTLEAMDNLAENMILPTVQSMLAAQHEDPGVGPIPAKAN